MSKKYETRKHETGVEVLTTKGLFDSLADSEGEGRTGTDLMNDMFEDMELTRQSEEQEMSKPEEIKKYVNDHIVENDNDWNKNDPDCQYGYLIKQVIKVESCSWNFNFSQSTLLVKFEAKCSDGIKRKLQYKDWSCSGSYYDPPEQETYLEEVE